MSQNTKQLTPALRFPEFDAKLTSYPFKDIFLFSTGKNIKQSEASAEYNIPCVRYGELYHMYNEVIDVVINKTNLDKSELIFSKGDEILLPSAGEDPLDIGSASALTLENVAIGRTINILSPINEDVYCHKYASYYINEKLRKKISTLSKGSSISNVYNSDLKKLWIILPLLPEQQKIASFFTNVDAKITQLTQKKTLLEQYKKGVMQQIFSQELRFKNDDGNDFADWEEKMLGEVGGIFTGKTPSTSNKALWGGEIDFVTPTDINGENKYQKATNRTVFNSDKLKVLPKQSIMFTCIASIGKMALSVNPCITNQQINSLVPNKKFDNEYVYYALLKLTPKIKSTQSNTTLPIINKTDFSKFKIPVPSLKEQTKIANFLSDIDLKIEVLNTKIEHSKSFKKGLLQKMFV